MQVKIQSLEARIKSVEHEKDVENLAKQNMIDELLQQIDKLQQENAALEKENQWQHWSPPLCENEVGKSKCSWKMFL